MKFVDYQESAKKTAQMDVHKADAKLELVLGLSTETGSVARIYRRHIRDHISLKAHMEELKEELGDVLWYISMISTSLDLSLDEIAEENLKRIDNRYQRVGPRREISLPEFDKDFPVTERFPRQMVFEFSQETDVNGKVKVCVCLVAAVPNAFPDGPVTSNGKEVGFSLGKSIGDRVDDNSLLDDGYRFHDAVHMGFMAVLGWSPVMRALLRIKRKSKDQVDNAEDGARAADLDEAVSAILKEMSSTKSSFQKEADVDGEVRDIVRQVTQRLEVGKCPQWLWAQAINQGYIAMKKLHENGGGFLTVNLDDRSLTFSVTNPEI